MAVQIRIDPNLMRERSGEYIAQAETLQGVIERMDVMANSLLGEWEGISSEVFTNEYQQAKRVFINTVETINSLAAALRSVADVMEKTDDQVAQRIRRIGEKDPIIFPFPHPFIPMRFDENSVAQS